MRVELSTTEPQVREALRAVVHAVTAGAVAAPPGGAVPSVRAGPKNEEKLNLEFVWHRGGEYTPELPRVRELVRWFHEVARDLLETETAPDESDASARWRLRRTRYALTGWSEHPDTDRLRAFTVGLVAPILAAWRNAASPDAVRIGARKLLHELVWGYTTLYDAAKYDTRFVSEGAKPLYEELDRALAERRVGAARHEIVPKLQHEHVHTRSDVVERLLAGEGAEALRAEACIVTKTEHEKLDEAEGRGWERYVSAGIRVWDRATGDWASLVAGRRLETLDVREEVLRRA